MKPINEMTPDELMLTIRQLRRMTRNIARLHRATDRALQGFVRASGQAVCERCGLELRDHPGLEEFHLTLGCDGTLYHL